MFRLGINPVYLRKVLHMGTNYKILLAEDDENLGFMIKDYLELNNFKVIWEKNGKLALQEFFQQEYDLCVFDVMMPEKDGFTLAEEVRRINPNIPIIFLTAKTMKEDRIQGFKSGADDYITKPFSTEEFLLRVEAVIKRSYGRGTESPEKKGLYQLGIYEFDYQNLSLKHNDISQHLTRKEADMLKILFVHKNEILQRETALKIVWGNDDYFTGRSMDVFITRLRKYLKDDPRIQINNIHGVGFKMIIDEFVSPK
jgi:two-component system OmpR family response regulator